MAQSTTEAELIAASSAANEVVWLRRLITAWGHPPDAPTPLYEDNAACISTSLLPGQTNRNKHIDIKTHNIKDNISSGVIRLVHWREARRKPGREKMDLMESQPKH